jgi:small subunit ribosomal protein S20
MDKRCIISGFVSKTRHRKTYVMANTKQAAKRAKKSTKQRGSNMGLRTKLRSAIKKVQKAVTAGEHKAATAVLKTEQSVIDAMAGKRIIHKNKAARHKSRLAAQIKALATPRT